LVSILVPTHIREARGDTVIRDSGRKFRPTRSEWVFLFWGKESFAEGFLGRNVWKIFAKKVPGNLLPTGPFGKKKMDVRGTSHDYFDEAAR
jgi:hypothetical protein